jgi:hypothetical protein
LKGIVKMPSERQIVANRRNAGTSTGQRAGASRAFPPRGGQPMFEAEHIPEVEALASPRRAPDRETSACGNPHMRHSAVHGKPEPGRPAGRSNKIKITGQATENIAEVFERLGGVEGMVKWASNHPTEFYCKIYPKLIGVDVQAKTDEALKQEPALEALERVLRNIRASRQDGYEKDRFVTDHDASGGAAPESAVARTNGSAAVGKRSG